MASKQNPPKAQHYLPQMYLETFCDGEGLLWVYDKQEDAFRHQHPKITAVENDAYTLLDADGKPNTEIETVFAEMEGTAKPLLTKLHNGGIPTSDEREFLALFIANMRMRSPAGRSNIAGLIEKIGRWQIEMLWPYPDRIEIIAKKNHVLAYTLQGINMLAEMFSGFDWKFLRTAEPPCFVTSDRAFSLIGPPDHPLEGAFRGVGMATPGAGKQIALTSRTVLMVQGPGYQTFSEELSAEQVDAVSLMTYVCADRFVIGTSEEQLRRLHDIAMQEMATES